MQVAFYFAGEITQVLDANPWVRCASGNVFVCGFAAIFLEGLYFASVSQKSDFPNKSTLIFFSSVLKRLILTLYYLSGMSAPEHFSI